MTSSDDLPPLLDHQDLLMQDQAQLYHLPQQLHCLPTPGCKLTFKLSSFLPCPIIYFVGQQNI